MTLLQIHRVSPRPALAPVRGWRWWTALLLLVMMPATACYSTQPITGVMPEGATVVLQLSDRGRVALGDRIGASADQVQGIVQSISEGSYVLRVTSVRYLGGQTNRWSGELLTIPADLVSRATRREFSRARTLALSLGIAGAILGLFLTTDIFGSGAGDQKGEPGGGTGVS